MEEGRKDGRKEGGKGRKEGRKEGRKVIKGKEGEKGSKVKREGRKEEISTYTLGHLVGKMKEGKMEEGR